METKIMEHVGHYTFICLQEIQIIYEIMLHQQDNMKFNNHEISYVNKTNTGCTGPSTKG